jgi:hypothetical protein
LITGGGAQILDAAVGAAADEDILDGDVLHPRAGFEAHIGERLGRCRLLRRIGEALGGGTTPVIGTTSSGLVPQVTLGAMSPPSM